MSEIAEFDHGGLRYVVTASRFPDGRLAETFIDGPKIGSGAQIAAKDAAILASLCLQHGVSSDAILHSLEKLRDGRPSSPIGVAICLLEASSAGSLSAVDVGAPGRGLATPPSVPA